MFFLLEFMVFIIGFYLLFSFRVRRGYGGRGGVCRDVRRRRWYFGVGVWVCGGV